MEDDALLNEELHWSPRPGRRRRPPGANAITAVGLVITVVLWGITGVALTPFLSGPSGGGMIDPRALVVLVAFGVEMLIAVAIAGRVWVAIGPKARKVLRPFGVLGPLPMVIVAVPVALFVASLGLAPLRLGQAMLQRGKAPTTQGRNWRLLDLPERGVTYDEAVARCGASGLERVPSRDDLASFDPPYPTGPRVWLEQPDGAPYPLILDGDGKVTQIAGIAPDKPPHANVVCFQP